MITPRLQMILNNITGKTIADVGTDHGYIPIRAVSSGQCVSAIASDIKEGPLSAARENVLSRGLSDRISLRIGPGLEVLSPNEVEAVVIAGMGGEMICNVLSADKELSQSFGELILQPMNSQDLVRKFLSDNGYEVLREDIATEQHHVYNLIVARKGAPTVYKTELELHLPSILYKHELFYDLLLKKEREFKKIVNGLEKRKSENSEYTARYKQYSELLSALEELKTEIKPTVK